MTAARCVVDRCCHDDTDPPHKGERACGAAEVVAAADRLGAAFGRRDLAAALACFVPDDDIGYAGSEHGESATGRAAVSALFEEVFARPEAYSWRVTAVSVRRYADCAYLMADADGQVHTDAGERVPFAYRVSGLLEPVDGRWRWRHCHGCEPATAPEHVRVGPGAVASWPHPDVNGEVDDEPGGPSV